MKTCALRNRINFISYVAVPATLKGGSSFMVIYIYSDQEPVSTGRRPEKNVFLLFQDNILFYTTTSYIFATTSYFFKTTSHYFKTTLPWHSPGLIPPLANSSSLTAKSACLFAHDAQIIRNMHLSIWTYSCSTPWDSGPIK